jgi:hypothetical protein
MTVTVLSGTAGWSMIFGLGGERHRRGHTFLKDWARGLASQVMMEDI